MYLRPTHRFHIPPPHNPSSRRFSIATALQPPLIFGALLAALWAYKSAMLVLFQNRIIYMRSMPPFARSERIEPYAAACRPVAWRQLRIAAPDGPALALALGEIPERGERERVVVIYFHG